MSRGVIQKWGRRAQTFSGVVVFFEILIEFKRKQYSVEAECACNIYS